MISKWPVSWAEWVVIIIILIRGIGEQPKQTWNSERGLSGPRRGCHRSPLYRQVGRKMPRMIINRKPMIMLTMILLTGASPCPPTPGTKSTRSPAPRRSSVLRQLSSQGTRWLSGYGHCDAMLIMMQMTQVLSVVGATSSDSGRYLCRVYNQVSAFLFRFLV